MEVYPAAVKGFRKAYIQKYTPKEVSEAYKVRNHTGWRCKNCFNL